MAKGIRSKSQRKNRTFLRETLVKPLMRERQDKLAELMQQRLDEKQSPSLLNLKKLIPSQKDNTQTVSNEKKLNQAKEQEEVEDMEVAGEDSSDTESEQKDTRHNKNKKGHGKQGSKPKVVKSSKRPPKELVWFK
jgi:hypothetical protein